jgi:tyrosyl-DNA phosphodiesterase-1
MFRRSVGCNSLEEYAVERRKDIAEKGLVVQVSSISSLGVENSFLDEIVYAMTPRTADHRVNLIWPTVATIRNSNQGYYSGGSLPARQRDIFDSSSATVVKSCLRNILRRWEGEISGRSLVMPHMKCYFEYAIHHTAHKRKRDNSDSDTNIIFKLDNNNHLEASECSLSWFLLTSSNLSMAAWGKKEKKGKQLYIKSYELGVLFLPELIKSTRRNFSCTPQHAVLGVDAADKEEMNLVSFPVPFRFPAPAYSSGDIPWTWDCFYDIPDRFGNVSC